MEDEDERVMISSDEAQERRRKYIADILPSSLYLPLSDTGCGELRVRGNVRSDCCRNCLSFGRFENEIASVDLERLDVYEHDGEFEENRTKRRGERFVSRTRTDGGGVVTELGGVFYHVRVFEARVSRAEEEERGFKK